MIKHNPKRLPLCFITKIILKVVKYNAFGLRVLVLVGFANGLHTPRLKKIVFPF